MRGRTVLALSVALVVASCTQCRAEPGSPSSAAPTSLAETPSPGPVTDVDSFVQALQVAGLDVRIGETQRDRLFRIWPPGRDVCIGPVRVFAYEFADEAAAGEVRAAITPDGYGIPTGGEALAHVDWIGPPHFFAGGRLIVLYLAGWRQDRQDERRTLDALELVLGPQFADSDEGGRWTGPGLGPAEDPCMDAP